MVAGLGKEANLRGKVGLSLVEVVRIALRAMAANPLRSALTALGVVIGVAAVVALTMVGQGTTQRITDRKSVV